MAPKKKASGPLDDMRQVDADLVARLRESIELRPTEPTAYFNLGMLFLTKHEGELHVPLKPYEHAHRAFQYAALLQPNNLQFENAERKSREHLGKMQRVNPSEDDDEDD